MDFNKKYDGKECLISFHKRKMASEIINLLENKSSQSACLISLAQKYFGSNFVKIKKDNDCNEEK